MEFQSIKKVHEGKFITRYDLQYKTVSGNVKNYEMISRDHDMDSFEKVRKESSDAVVLIIHNEEGDKILLNKEYRMAVGEVALNFPAGLIDAGEDAKTAAARELWEETGLKLVKIEEEWPSSYSGVGLTNERSTVVVGVATGEFQQSTSEEEEIEARWYTKEELKELLKTDTRFAARTQAYCMLWVKA